MFALCENENWARLCKAQLITTNGQYKDNWGFACLFFDSRFNTFLEDEYTRIDGMAGNHFHIFSFVNPPKGLIRDREDLLERRLRNNEISKKLYEELSRELFVMRNDTLPTFADIDYEREKMRKEIISKFDGEISTRTRIDLILLNLDDIDEGSPVDIEIVKLPVKNLTRERLFDIIENLSNISTEIYLSDAMHKHNEFRRALKREKFKLYTSCLSGDLLRGFSNVKDIITKF